MRHDLRGTKIRDATGILLNPEHQTLNPFLFTHYALRLPHHEILRSHLPIGPGARRESGGGGAKDFAGAGLQVV